MANETNLVDGSEPAQTQRVQPRRNPITRRSVVSWISGFLAVMVLLEFGVRAVSGKLSDPIDYINIQSQTIVRDMDVLRAAHITSDLTFVGNSLVKQDIDAAKFEGTLPGVDWAHNVAMGGFEITTTQRWLLDEVVPRLAPRRVVIGISSSDFNGGRTVQSLPAYNASRAIESGVYGDLDRALEISELSKYRDQLRDPYRLYQAARGKVTHIPTGGSLRTRAKWKLSYPTLTPARLARARRTELAYIRSTQLRQFRVGTNEMRAFVETLQVLRTKGIDVAVILMPVSTQYIASHPRGETDFAAWRTTVTSAAQLQQVTVLDLSRTMPDADFRDYEHLNVAPAERFTSLVLSRLRAIGW